MSTHALAAIAVILSGGRIDVRLRGEQLFSLNLLFDSRWPGPQLQLPSEFPVVSRGLRLRTRVRARDLLQYALGRVGVGCRGEERVAHREGDRLRGRGSRWGWRGIGVSGRVLHAAFGVAAER